MSDSDIVIRPCAVYWGVASSEQSLGKTQGGVSIKFETKTAELKSDQNGDLPINEVIIGQGCTVTVNLAEVNLANLAYALNQTRKVLSGKYGFAGTNKIGTSLQDLAKSLLLKPWIGGSATTNTELWWRFPKAAPIANFDLAFTVNNQQIIPVVFKCFPDASSNWYYAGDETAAISGS